MAIADRITWIDTKLVNYRIGLLQNTQSHKEKIRYVLLMPIELFMMN